MAKETGLLPPFNYAQNLIGEEIIYRTLLRQRTNHDNGHYGMPWNNYLLNLLNSYYLSSQVMRTYFAIPPVLINCIPDPPCIWSKEKDELSPDVIVPIFLYQVANQSFAIEVLERTDAADKRSYTAGSSIITYNQNQAALDPGIQNVFFYFEPGQPSSVYSGKAIFRTSQFENENLVNQFDYLFDLLPQ